MNDMHRQLAGRASKRYELAVASLLGPQVKDRSVPYRWREQRCAARQNGAAHVSEGSTASVEQSWHVGFTSNSGRAAVTQRTDASGRLRILALQKGRGDANATFL